MKIILAVLLGIPLIISAWLVLYMLIADRRLKKRQRDLEKAFEIGFDEGQVAFKEGKTGLTFEQWCSLPHTSGHSDNIAQEARAGYVSGWESAACRFEGETENIMDAEELEIMLDDLERFANGEMA